jgi:hypothetical protein
MKAKFLLLILFLIYCSMLFSNPGKNSGNEVQKISALTEGDAFGPDKSSFPQPFLPFENTRTYPAASTGYYFVDSHSDLYPYIDSLWNPGLVLEDTMNSTDGDWFRVLSGPRQTAYANITQAENYWKANPNGHAFFRNPAIPGSDYSYFTHGGAYSTDSTDNAFAGPMPLGIKGGFYFNGIRYDSFYVSTNGIIALTNRRYLYDGAGNKALGSYGDCYDRMSMDWFARSRTSESSTMSLADTVPDNWGYQYSVLGNDVDNPEAGIRKRVGSLNSFPDNQKTAVIAPFFGDLEASQYSTKYKRKDDFGKVLIKKFDDSSKIVIYLLNFTLVRENTIYPGITVDMPLESRPGDLNHISMSAQIILDARDSSVKITYDRLTGNATDGNMNASARDIVRYNTSAGVCGWARHINNYKGKNPVTYSEYKQYTHYFSKYQEFADYPTDFSTVCFRQWKNVLRVQDITYRVRSTDKIKSMDYTERVPSPYVNNFEILVDEPRIGAVQPVALIQNMSNDIQGIAGAKEGSGVNYQAQDLNFRVKCLIYNQATNRVIYNRTVNIDSAGLSLAADTTQQKNYFGNKYCKVRYSTVTQIGEDFLANNMRLPNANGFTGLNGIPPYGYAEVYFPPFEPERYNQDEFKTFSEIGKMSVYVEAEPYDPKTSKKIYETWPFDNSMERTLFVMKRLTSISDNFSEYFVMKDGYNSMDISIQPSPYKWVNIGSEIVKGEDVSRHPVLPRRPIATKKSDYKNRNSIYEGVPEWRLTSPLVNMNRVDIDGTDFSVNGQKGGDELRSFPIDMRGRHGAILSLSVQRTNNSYSKVWNRGWSDNEMVGPEPRTILNNDPYQPFNFSQRSAAFSPDELVIELAKSSTDQINGITNIGVPLPYIPTDKRSSWRYHPRRVGASPITNMAAFTLYGGGGSVRGFLEKDKDSALTTVTGLRNSIYDDGMDEYFNQIFVAIPDTFIRASYEGAKNIRFRVKVNANNDLKSKLTIPDDNDDFYIDNVYLQFACECGDIETKSCRIIVPTTTIPASQSIKIPLRVSISNNTSVAAPSFRVIAKIYVGSSDSLVDPKQLYCKWLEMPFLSPGEQIEISLPEWDVTNASLKDGGKFVMYAMTRIPGGDNDYTNDTTYYDFELKLGETYAYETDNPINNVSIESNQVSRGLSLSGFSFGGKANSTSAEIYNSDPYAFGSYGGDNSGRIAMKFELLKPDTIKGYQAFFVKGSDAPDKFAFSLHKDSSGLPDINTIDGSLKYSYRGFDDFKKGYFYDQYTTTLLDKPLVLEKGVYWLAISQLGTTGLNLGAGNYRMGMRTMNVSIQPPINITREVGAAGNSLLLHKDLRIYKEDSIKGNQNLFAYENYRGSGNWKSFMPTTGNPGYAHLHHFGATPVDDGYTWTLSNGTWLPYLKPYFGMRDVSGKRIYEICYDIPVELTAFSGKSRTEGIDLFWETASEINNYGFYIEKKQNEELNWKQISFVKGKGTSSKINRYSFIDKDVALNNIYQYRLLQVDLDGSASCGTYSNIITINHNGESGLVLEQNYPNPFNSSTLINFSIPEKCFVRLEILDLMGNIVSTPVNGLLDGKSHEVYWDRTTTDGRKAAAGTYIYRLTAGDEVRIGKMTVVE